MLNQEEKNQILERLYYFENYFYLKFIKSEAYRKLTPRTRRISIGSGQDDNSSIFKNILFRYAFGDNENLSGEERKQHAQNHGHINIYKKPPHPKANFDLYIDFMITFEKNKSRKTGLSLYDYVEKMTVDAAIKVSRSELDLDHAERKWYTMEDMSEKEIINKRLMVLTGEFYKYLNTMEYKIFRNQLKPILTYAELSKEIGPTRDCSFLSTQNIRTIQNELEFKYLAYLTLNNFPHVGLSLSGFNRYPSLCRRYFKQGKLTAIPDNDSLKRVYHKGDWKPRLEYTREQIESAMVDIGYGPSNYTDYDGPNKGFLYQSIYDFKGNKHDHAVTYFSARGYAYCHVTKQTMDLFHDEEFGKTA